MNLGATGASAVKHYLAQLGVSMHRGTTTRRGPPIARVDLRLAGQ